MSPRQSDPIPPVTPLPFEAGIDPAGLDRERTHAVARTLDAAEAAALARFLGLEALDALAFQGALTGDGAQGWRLTGRLTGAAVQACVVTLEPVPETIDVQIERRFVPQPEEAVAETVEIGAEDLDAPETLTGPIDLATVMTEALALSLAPYPRAPQAEFAGRVHAGPGVAPLTDEAMHPFAGLARLRPRLTGDGEN